MPSTLRRMFNYGLGGAKENFTTEALAAAIREEPAPFLSALEKVGIQCSRPIEGVDTQVKGGGTPDLLLRPRDQRPVLIEVKVGAGESGDQLTRYQAWAERQPENLRPHLVLLSSKNLTEDKRWRWLSWQELWKGIRGAPDHSRWHDLAIWVKEERMADDTFEPVTIDEAGTLLGAHALLWKAVHILTPASAHMNTIWTTSGWPVSETHVRKQLVSRFGTWPSYSVQHTQAYRCGCAMGIYVNGEGTTALSLWVWAPPKLLAERSRIQAIGAQLSEVWKLDTSGWELLRADRPLLSFEDHAAASAWLIERCSEMQRAGLTAVFEGSGLDPEKPAIVE